MLARDVRADLRASGRAMLRLVWPKIAAHCGGGTLVSVEGDGEELPLALSMLDQFAGVDYLQVTPEGVLYGIAARVQFVDGRPFDTFTIRRTRASGARTELAKRRAAYAQLHHEPIFPHWTVQGYVTLAEERRLLSVAVIPTKMLVAQIECGRAGSSWHVNATHNAEFVYVAWDELPSYWAPFIWREDAS